MTAMTKRGFSAAAAAFLGWFGFGRPAGAKQRRAPAEPPPPPAFAETRLGIAGGTPLIFIPGLTAPAAAWSAIAPAFAETHDVRILHLAGMAGAPPAPWTGSFLEDRAQAIAGRLAALDLENVALVGHSLGGTLAMLAAMRSPRVGRVVVVDQVPFLAQWMTAGQVQTDAQAKSMGERARTAFLEADWKVGPPNLDQRLLVETRDESFRPVVRGYLLASDQATVASAMSELIALDLRPRLPTLRQPTLVLMSYDPTLIPAPPQIILSGARLQFAGLPRGEIRLIEGSRHWIMHDRPDALRAALKAFLAS